MRSGFTLLEVLIATAIASLLTTALFFSYDQINNVVRYVTDTTDLYESAILVEQQISKDISGAFIPVQAIEDPEPEKTKKNPADAKAMAGRQEDGKTTEPLEKKESKKRVVLKDPFISKNAGKNLSMFTFITANPMRVYWGKKTGEPKPSIARIVYTLEANKESDKKSPRYELYRQEGKELELAPYTKKESSIQKYLIADNITACSLTFVVADEQGEQGKEGEKKGKDEQQSKSKDIEIKEFNDWVIGKDKKDVRARLKIPDEVSMKITIADELAKRSQGFVFSVRIAAGFQEPPTIKPKQQKPQQDKKEQKPSPNNKLAQNNRSTKQEMLVSGANSVVQNLRAMFRT